MCSGRVSPIIRALIPHPNRMMGLQPVNLIQGTVGSLMKQSSDEATGSVCAGTPHNKERRGNRRLILVVLLVAAAIIVWEEILEYHVIPKRWGTVEAGQIYRSGRLSTTLIEPMLRRHSIDVIVDLTSEIPTDKEHIAQKAAAEELGIRVLRFPLGGSGTGNIACYAGAIAAIVDARRSDQTVLSTVKPAASAPGASSRATACWCSERPPRTFTGNCRTTAGNPKTTSSWTTSIPTWPYWRTCSARWASSRRFHRLCPCCRIRMGRSPARDTSLRCRPEPPGPGSRERPRWRAVVRIGRRNHHLPRSAALL